MKLRVPGDKAISHRAAILLALSRTGGTIRNFSMARDCAATVRVLRALGAGIRQEKGVLRFDGGGWESLKPPRRTLDCGNSGSTMRMMAGVLAGCPFESRLTGDLSLRRRPMDRVAEPLRAMGAQVHPGPPLRIRGGALRGILYASTLSSAQVKTAVLLAGLRAEGRTKVMERLPSRDHTERLLLHLGVEVRTQKGSVSVEGGASWAGRDLEIPGDPSSAAFLLVQAALQGRREVLEVEGLCLNPTRLGFLAVLRRMGAQVRVRRTGERCGEPVGSVQVEGGRRLRGTRIEAQEVPSLIDEIPILVLAATQARGLTVVAGAQELRVKESDRIAALCEGLGRMGARIEPKPDGFAIRGPTPLQGAVVDSKGDHRIAMTLAVAGTLSRGRTELKGAGCIAVSFPGFARMLRVC